MIATDAAGNVSAATAVPTITADSTVPPAPTVTSPSAPVSVNTATDTITGTAAAGALVKVWKDPDKNGVVDAADSVAGSQQLGSTATAWSINVSLAANAANHFVVTATNAAGTQSGATLVPTITQDSIAPAAPVLTDPSGPVITNQHSYNIQGTAEANALV
ncbi:MAG: hypothetical protein E6K70_23835, partial [Planctomycetota bacterium]